MASRWLPALLALAAACAAPVSAMDLAQAYALAQDNDATLRAARAATAARRERLPQARSQLLPRVTLSLGRARNQLETTSPDLLGRRSTTETDYTSRSNSLSVRQPLFRKELVADLSQAEVQVAEAEEQLRFEEQRLVVRLAGAYFEVLLAGEQLRLSQAQVAAFAAQLDAAQQARGAGSGTRTDVDEAQSRLDLASAGVVEAQQALELARQQLEVLTHRPTPDALAALDPARLRLEPPAPARLQDWLERAEADSPELASAQAQLRAAQLEVEKARAGRYPTLDAYAEYSDSGNENKTRTDSRDRQAQVGLQASIPLFQGGYVNSRIRETLAAVDRAEARHEEVRRDLRLRVQREFRGATDGLVRVRALEQAVRSSGTALESSRRSFEAGARTRLDILDAEQQVVAARRDLAQARFTLLMSRLRLQALAGGAGPAQIAELNLLLAP